MHNLSTHNAILRKNILTRFLRIIGIFNSIILIVVQYSIFLLTDRHFETLEKKN